MIANLKRIDSTYRGKPTHHYKMNGVRIDGVTTLLSNGVPKPALLPWGIRSVAEYAADHLDTLIQMQPMGREAIVSALKQSPYTDRDQAANRGTEVHGFAEKLVAGEAVDPPDPIRGHVESCARFLDDWRIEPVYVETVVASQTAWYAGTLDLVADVAGRERMLFDYKTTRSGIYGETALQLAAYRYAEVYLDADGVCQPWAPGIERCAAVWIRGDGYDVKPLVADEETFKTFRHVAYCARRFKQLNDLVGATVASPDELWSAPNG